MTERKAGSRFFQLMAAILLAIVVAGFGAMQVFAPEQTSPFRPLLAVHAAVFLGWYVLLVTQPWLIGRRNHARHRQIGQMSIALAIAIVVLGFLITREAYLRPGWSIAGLAPAPSAIFPLSDIVNFTIAYTLAFLHRRNGEAHKRLMLFAGILMIDPAVARLVGAAGGPPPAILAIELALIFALFVHDRRSLRRVHWASWTGLALFAAAMVAKFTVAGTAAWAGLVTFVFAGPPPA